MIQYKKILLTLALLITAAAGAWAQGTTPEPVIVTINEAKIGTTEYTTLGEAISSAQDGDIIQLQSDVALTAENYVEKKITIDFNGYIISAAGNQGAIWWRVDMTFIDSDDTGRGGMKCMYGRANGTEAKANLCGGRYDDPAETILTGQYAPFYNIPTGYEIVNINAGGSADADGFKSRVVRNYLNDTKTVATIPMPASDVTVNYTLVRDMSVQMTATMGDGTDGLRYRVKKSEQNPGKYEPADINMMQVVALVAVNDGIEQKALTLNQDYFCRIYKLDEQTQQPAGDGVELADFDFAPGLYALKAFATDGSNYDGETALSNTFTLFQGYEVTVPAGEYVTYYKNEALYVEDTDAKLYTITEVNETATEATLSDAITVAPASTPILVKNNSGTTKTILLIPTTETAATVTFYDGFKGTLEAKTTANNETYGPWNMAEGKKYYGFNGTDFVWLKQGGPVAAHRCWIELSTTAASAAPQIRLIFSSTTGIESVDREQSTVDGWYDLNGRRLPGKPTKKGVYIVNGKKMVVK